MWTVSKGARRAIFREQKFRGVATDGFIQE